MARLTFVSAFVVALGCLGAPAASSRRVPECWSGYSYAGVQSVTRGYGVSATLTMSAEPTVGAGHVAAWIGVGGVGLGPGGTDEWLQAGIDQEAGGRDALYYEFMRPGDQAATYVSVGLARAGEPHSIVVYERARQQETWRVLIDGVRVSAPIALPASHGRFEPVATAESWDGGVAGSCNDYAFDFASLAVRTQYAGAWQPFSLRRVLHDPAYELSLGASGFRAASR